jgi:hypothetical protein
MKSSDGLGIIIINKLNFIVSYTPNANLRITAAITAEV